MKVICQIGRFERMAFNLLKFEKNGNIYPSYLSSFALRQYFRDNGSSAKVIIIYPVSLLLNRTVINNIDENIPREFRNLIQSLLNNKSAREDYFKNPYPYFAEHPHSKEAEDFFVIHSVGQYEGETFTTTLEELILEIFVELVERYQKEPFSELYLDVSSGHNIYVSALLEAGRLFLTFYNLQNFHLEDEEKLKVYITFSDPIIPSNEGPFKIHEKFPLEVATYFYYPQRPVRTDFNTAYLNFVLQLVEQNRDKRTFFNQLFTHGYYFYSAIKNNTPLVLYTKNYHSEEDINKGIEELIKLYKEKINQDYKKTGGVSFELYRKAFIMLSLYKGIVRVLQKKEIRRKEAVSVSEIEEKFCKESDNVYKYFGLSQNSNYLSHELKRNFKNINISFSDEWRLLKDYISVEPHPLKPRNFFAHCGFERNCVYVRKKGSNILIKYDQNLIAEIENFVLKF